MSTVAGLSHGTDFLVGVADRTLDTVGTSFVHGMLDTTKEACTGRGIFFHVGGARRNLHCTVDMHMWHTMCLPLRYSAKRRHSWHIVWLHCNVDKTISAGALHGWLVFGGVARRNLHCTVDMHT